ncbi:MAG TPA: TetR/AcrR family transcriptional regulator [Mesorhizobium sp.]|nr:TetR/AcrR family transcriptional regulator [Mesorhizobium sp.]
MAVSNQERTLPDAEERGARARTARLMLDTAVHLMQSGVVPSVSDVAEAAEVSRATAYRYFPSQAALVHAVVDAALGPILDWTSQSADTGERTRDLLERSLPRIDAFEATFRAALKLSLDQWAQRQAGTLGNEPAFTRGHRVDLLRDAIAPLRGRVSDADSDRLAKALSLLFGIEALIVMKDIWGASAEEAQDIVQWAAAVLVRSIAPA